MQHAMNPALHDVRGYHSHAKVYTRTAVILTLITAVEIGILYVPVLKPVLVPVMVVLAVQKLAMVVGTFMHLRDDHNVFRLVFLAPMVMAFLMIYVLTLLVMPHFSTYGAGYVRLATQKSPAERGVVGADSAGATAAPAAAKAAVDYDKLFAQTKDFSAGAAIFGEKCASCHGASGGGVEGMGPNMTDDCYKHGGKVADLVKVLQNGVSGTAMLSFADQLSEEQLASVALYVRSLRGQNVAGGKACEGNKATD